MAQLALSDCHSGGLEKHWGQRIAECMKPNAAALPIDSQFV
jgi:hypothetical protein